MEEEGVRAGEEKVWRRGGRVEEEVEWDGSGTVVRQAGTSMVNGGMESG